MFKALAFRKCWLPACRLCRSACNCFVARKTCPLRRHRLPWTRRARSGTVRLAAEPCTSSNGSLPRKSCSALHLNPNGAQREPLSASLASDRAPARTESSCLIGPRMPSQPTSQSLPATSARRFSVRFSPANGRSCPSQRLSKHSGPDRINSNPIDISGSGSLQVAVSGAPAPDHAPPTGCAAGAPDTALRLLGSYRVSVSALAKMH